MMANVGKDSIWLLLTKFLPVWASVRWPVWGKIVFWFFDDKYKVKYSFDQYVLSFDLDEMSMGKYIASTGTGKY